ncbi:MAG: hypothetical protein Salg2KO_04120 [Salibacteraceae bacterium]
MPKKPPNSFYKYTTMAGKMAIVLLVFTLGGKYTDAYLQLSFPWFTLFGTLFGAGAAIYSMISDLK